MAISYVGQKSGATNAVTVPAHAIGDILVLFLYNGGSATVPSLPAIYTNITSNTGSSNAFRVGYLVATSTTDGAGSSVSSSGFVVTVYRGVDSIGSSNSNTSASGATVTIPSIASLASSSGESWIVAFGASGQNTSMSTPAGTSRRSSFSRAGSMAIGVDSNGGVSSWADHTSTLGTNAKGAGVSIELVAPSTGTKMKINIGDEWKEISKVQINIGDEWKEVSKVQINVGDEWKSVF